MKSDEEKPFSYSAFVHQLPTSQSGKDTLYDKLGALQGGGQSRPFEIVNYQDKKNTDISKEFLDKLSKRKKTTTKKLKNFRVPLPENEEERRMQISEMAAYLKSIGDEIIGDLVRTMKTERGLETKPSDDDILKQAIESTRNYIVMLLDLKKTSKEKYTFFNDLTFYYHLDNPEKEFEKIFKSRLDDKINDVGKLAPYMKMVKGKYFENKVRSDDFTLKKMESLIPIEEERLNREQINQRMTNAQAKLNQAKNDLKNRSQDAKNAINDINNELNKINNQLQKLDSAGTSKNDVKYQALLKNRTDLKVKLMPLDIETKITKYEMDIKICKKDLDSIPLLKEFKNLILHDPIVSLTNFQANNPRFKSASGIKEIINILKDPTKTNEGIKDGILKNTSR